MADTSGRRALLGCLMLLLGLGVVALGAVLTPLAALALHAAASLASMAQGLLQRRYGERFGLPGLGALPIATAFGCSIAFVPPLDAVLWWPVAAALAVLAGLLLVAVPLWVGERLGQREPLPSVPEGPRRASAPPPFVGFDPPQRRMEWRPLGDTGLQVCTEEYGEVAMGGPPYESHTLSVGVTLNGEQTALTDDGRWWIVRGAWRGDLSVLDLRERTLYRGPRELASVDELVARPIGPARLRDLGLAVERAFEVRDDGLWWPQGEPVPPTEAAFGPPQAGLRRVALLDREWLVASGDVYGYACRPLWRVDGADGALPLFLLDADVERSVWRDDGLAALIRGATRLDGAPSSSGWYHWQAGGEGRWLDFGNGWGSGVAGASTAHPEALHAEAVDVAFAVGVTRGGFPTGFATNIFDASFSMGTMPWFRGVDARGWPVYDDLNATVPLRSRRRLDDPADAARVAPLIARHASGVELRFEPMGEPVDPREVRPFRLRGLTEAKAEFVLDDVAPLPRWLDAAGRFVALQAVASRAMAPVVHVVDRATGRITTLRREVAELRLQAAHEGELQWIELLGQRPIHAAPDPLVPMERVPGHNAWNRCEADPGRFLALRGRRARVDPESGALVLRPPWTESASPVSPLHPGDVLYRPPQAPPVLLVGAHGESQDDWPREQEPRILGRLLTDEGHAIAEAAQGMIASDDGRWLLFARCRPAFERGVRDQPRIEDWEVALLDRREHVLHARAGVHFGGLPFFGAFDGDRIAFETSEVPWWREDVERAPVTWSLASLLERLDATPLRRDGDVWVLREDTTSSWRWRDLLEDWRSGRLAG